MRAIWLMPLAFVFACGGEPDAPPQAAAVPVTAITLERAAPEIGGRLAGLAVPYREEEIGFEVAGRVDFVYDVGKEVGGPRLGADRALLEQGDVLAWLDFNRYQQDLEAAQLAKASADKELAAQELEVGTVSKSQLEEAQAKEKVADEDVNRAVSQEQFARTELGRQANLLQEGVVSQADYDKADRNLDSAVASLQGARSSLDGAKAAVAQAEDNIQLKQANIEQTKAGIAELVNKIEQAQTDLDDCTLHAPFTGRITDRQVGRGGYVGAGAPVVTLTMMDPIKVVVMTSAEKSRRLLPGTQVGVFPKDLTRFTSDDALYGAIFDKAEVADPSTRTFQVEVILRNRRRRPFLTGEGGVQGAAIDQVMPALYREAESGGPLFVHPSCFLEEGGASFVYRLPGLKMGRAASAELTGLLQPEKIAVERLDEYFTLRFAFQRIAEGSGIEAGDLLIRDPRPEQLKGAVMSGSDWAIRPGDIVPVSFDLGAAPSGFYVPVEAIATLNGATSVFVVGDDERARSVPVSVHETIGLQRRIEGDGLEDGLRLVVQGLHYVGEGDRLQVVSKIGG